MISKIVISMIVILSTAGCSPQNKTEEAVTLNPADSLTLVLDAKPGIPIGYGQTWKCVVREVVVGELSDTELTLSTYGSFGDTTDELYNGYFQSTPPFDSYNALEVDFERLDERPAALSGFKAADDTIWQITNVNSAKYRLPWAIEGNYVVSGPDMDHKALGDLKLSNNEYIYTSFPEDGLPACLGFPMLYATEPEGSYTIEYYGDIEPDVQLENLPDNEILLTINFDPEDKYADFEERRKKFLIRNDRTNRELYFHSIVSEFEMWRVRKGWEE
ncbi:MAG: hypothetical protein GY771_05135 [bacterium]|nr:hypothetical protein [bacterium]